MNIAFLLDTPPWEWPDGTDKFLKKILSDHRAKASDRVAAADLAGSMVVINDDLVDALLMVLRSDSEPEELRATAAISLGPVLDQADTDLLFDDSDSEPITEATFHEIQATLEKLYLDESVPKLVRRRIMEASVRASNEWHQDAIRTAYSTGDRDWMLTAVFAMRYVRGFDAEITESLKSADPEIHLEAVRAAGDNELESAWPLVLSLVKNSATGKNLLIAAIGAVGSIRPKEARAHLSALADSEDEDIAEAADEAILMADVIPDDDDEDDDEDAKEWVN